MSTTVECINIFITEILDQFSRFWIFAKEVFTGIGTTFHLIALVIAIHRFFQEQGFVYVNTPIITTSDCEGAGEMFRVTTLDPKNPPLTESGEVDWSQDFFGKHASLTVSGQLNAENFAMAFGDVYTFGPTFRAENSNTTRHAAEFWMIEPEMAFADLNDYMDNAEAMLKYVLKDVMATCPDELNMLNKFVDKGLLERLDHVANSDFARVTYTEAVEILEQAVAAGHKFDYPVSWGIDLQTEHERFLTEEHFKRPTFVTDYPAEIKAFYMRMNEDGKTVAAADCLVPGIGEIIGGSQREDNYDTLLQRMHECGLKEKDYQFYLDLRKYGSARHAGFGLGFERMVMYLTGIGNILLLDVAGAFIACTTLLLVRIPNPERSTAQKPSLWREFREGFGAMHAVPGMGWFFTLAVLVWFFIMPVGVMFPLMTLQHFGGNTYDMSLIEIVWGGGALIGGAIMGARVYRVNRIVLVNLMYLTIGMSFTISGLLPPTAFVWFAVLSAIEGITSSVFNSSFVSVVQTRIDAGVLGRVMSLYYSFGLLPSAIGLLGTGFLAEQVGLTTTFVIAGLVICTLGLTAFCIPSVMRLDRQSKSAELQTKATDGK